MSGFPLFSVRSTRGEDAEDVVLAHDEVLGSGHFGLVPGVFPEENAVAGFNVERDQLAIFEPLAMAYSDDLALLGFLLSGIGDDDAVTRGFFFVDSFHYNAVV